MAALTFDKKELGNLEYSLTCEVLATDRRGGYMNTTIVCCNTRKYHGLIVSPIDESGREFVLLSSLDETIVLDGQRFNLALHRFRGTYEPRGHKYITDFEYTPTPTITYRIGDVVLKKELLWIHKRTQLMVRYTMLSSSVESVSLQLRPYLAFRDRHALCKANLQADARSYPVKGGVKCRLYDGFPWLYMQVSDQTAEFIPAPDWYYDFEYTRELERGYEGHEDLLTPGYFEMTIKSGESVILSASTEENIVAKGLVNDYKASLSRRTDKVDCFSCLRHSARQFVVRRPNGDTEIVAGYPWYESLGRDALISLPGLTLEQGYTKDCLDVIDTLIKANDEERINDSYKINNSVDTPLWLYRTLQMLESELGAKEIWSRYGATMKYLLERYRSGEGCDMISLHDNGLIWAWSDEKSLTWQDTTIDTKWAPRRNGYMVEVQALWYNAVSYTLELARKFKDKEFVESWEWVPERAKNTFSSLFWLNDGYLADFVNHDSVNRFIRPNMIVASALPYKMIDEQQQVSIIRTVQQHLLTPRGLRSLSPRNILYGVNDRGAANKAPKNGSVWVWPLAFYVKACFDVLGESYLSEAQRILDDFDSEIQTYGIGSIAEYFDPDPPFNPQGAISQAWSVAAVLEISHMVTQYEENSTKAVKKSATTKKTATTKRTTTTKKSTTTKSKARKTPVKKEE